MKRLDLIIDALENSRPIFEESPRNFNRHHKALAVARELRELEPVAQIRIKDGYWIDTRSAETKSLTNGLHNIYALGDEK